ncbi:hypothetical protein [Kitasatospora sp. NPDC059803]|uniref:hypothetical protein n=1 Tax=Kitasatospora sp. NPDC059803 TaxID=3346953 RepID=UPI0036676598
MSGGSGGFEQGCPVCCTPGEGGECPVCAWRLDGDHFLGTPTEEELRRDNRALRAARDRWNARALAALMPPDPASSDGETAQAAPCGRTSWEHLLAELVGQPDAALWFVELTVDRIGLIKATTDRNGIPRAQDAGGALWESLVPEFAADPATRAFQLAGGIGELPAVDRTALDDGVRRLLAHLLPPEAGLRIVLLSERPDWLLLARAAAVLCSLRMPDAEIGPAPGGTTGVRRLLRAAPLRRDHELLLAAVEDSGAVRPQTRLLFQAGARLRPEGTASMAVTVHGGLDDGAVVTLPILAGRDTPSGGRAVATYRVRLPALRPVELTFVLRGPGEVEMLLPDGSAAEPSGPADVAELIDGLPSRLRRPSRLDLLLAVELSYGASPEEVVERLGFAREVLALMAEKRQDTAVAAVGYYDHGVRESPYTPRRTLLRTVALGTPAAALAALAGWQPLQRHQDTVSALEDALGALRLLAASTVGALPTERRALVLGRRPPGEPATYGRVPACPLGVDWRRELTALRSSGVEVLVRRDGPPHDLVTDRVGRLLQQYGANAWAELGADGVFDQRYSPALAVRRLLPGWQVEGAPCALALAHPLL